MAKSQRTCAFDTCTKPHKARGWCVRHYGQWLEGKPLTAIHSYSARGTTTVERMASYTDKGDHCWTWTGSIMSNGYGTVFFGGKSHLAHRVAYELAIGVIPAGLSIDHKCHNTRCVRPEHLHAVTHGQNMENRRGAQARSRSGKRGVFWHSFSKSWHVVVRHNNVSHSGGYFKNLDEAELAAIKLRNVWHSNNLRDREELRPELAHDPLNEPA